MLAENDQGAQLVVELEPHVPCAAAIDDADVLDRGRLVDGQAAEVDAKLALLIDAQIVGDIGEGDCRKPLEDPVGADPQSLETGVHLALQKFFYVNICQQTLPLRACRGRAEAGADGRPGGVEVDQIFQGEEPLSESERHARQGPLFHLQAQ